MGQHFYDIRCESEVYQGVHDITIPSMDSTLQTTENTENTGNLQCLYGKHRIHGKPPIPIRKTSNFLVFCIFWVFRVL